jgi:single-strand DNA-binding protein
MTDINTFTVGGRLTRDAEAQATPQGLPVVNFTIASNRSRKEGDGWKQETAFFDCAAYGKTAENIKPKLSKGSPVVVTGRIQQQTWESNGGQKSRFLVLADIVQVYPKGQTDTATATGGNY